MKTKRIERTLSNLQGMGLDQLILCDPESLYYLLGHSYDPGERMLALYLDTRGNVKLFHNHMFFFPELEGLEICEYDDVDDYTGMFAGTLAPGKVGVDKFFRAKFLIPMMEKRPDVSFCLGSAAVDTARKYKDEEELERMRYASHVNDLAVEEGIRHVGEPLTEQDMGKLISAFHAAHGGNLELEQLICFGANSAEPHHVSDKTRMEKGKPCLFDIYDPIYHYNCDMTRTVFYGGVTEEQRNVYEIVKEANLAGIEAVKPGTPLREIDAAARRIIEKAGYGPYFTHRLGHGCGLSLHEPPDVSSASEDVALPGMIFSVEPGIYLPGNFGVRIEDLVAVTEDGVEVLNHFTKDLIVVD